MSEPTIGEAPNPEEDTGSAGYSDGSRLTAGTSRASSGRSEAQVPDGLPGGETGARQYAPPPFPGGSVFALEEALSDGDDEAAKEDDPAAAEGFPPAANEDFGVMDMQASFVELLPELLSMARYSLLPEEGATARATGASAGTAGPEEPDNSSNGKAPVQNHEEAVGQLLTLTERLSILPMQISVPPPEPEAPRSGQAGASSAKPALPRSVNEIPLETIDSTNLPEMSVLLQLLPSTGSFISLPSQSCNLDLPAPALHTASAGPGQGTVPPGVQGQQGHAGPASQPQGPYFAHRAHGTLSRSQAQPLAPPSGLSSIPEALPTALGPALASPTAPPTAAAMLADLQRVFESHGLPPSEAMQLARSAAAAAVPVAGGPVPAPAPAPAPAPGPAAPGPGPGTLGSPQPPGLLAPHSGSAAPGVVATHVQEPQQQQQQPSMSAKQMAAQALIALLARKAPGFAASAAAAAAAATANMRAAPAASSSGAAAPGALPGSCRSDLTASTAAAAHPTGSEAHGPAASEVTTTATTNEHGPNDHIGGIGCTSKKRRAGAPSPALMAGVRQGGSGGGGGGGESSGNDAEGEAPVGAAGQKLPGPVEVYVSGLTREGEQVTVEGVFHPNLYLAGQDCIWYQEQFVSRSAFEKAGHATANKWHCSIKVANTKHALGTWLTERGLPVLKGVPRRSRQQRIGYPAPPSGPGPGGAAAPAAQPAAGLNVLPVLAAALALRNTNNNAATAAAAAAAGAAPAVGPGMLQWPAAAAAAAAPAGGRSVARFHSFNASGSSVARQLAAATGAAMPGLDPSPAPALAPAPAHNNLTHHHRQMHSSCQLDDYTDTSDQPPVAPYFRVPSAHAHGNSSWGPTQCSVPSPALHASGPGPNPASGGAAYLPGPMRPPVTSPQPGHVGVGTWPQHDPACGWQQQGQHGEGQGLVPGALGTTAPDPFAAALPVDRVPSAAGGYGAPVAGAFGGGDWRAASGRSSGTLRSGGGLLGVAAVSFRSDLDPTSSGLGSYHGSCSPALHQQQQHNFTIGTADPPLQPRSVTAMRRNTHLRASMPVERYGGGAGANAAGGVFGSAGLGGPGPGARDGDSSFGPGSLGVGGGALSGGMGRAVSLQHWPPQGPVLGVGPLGIGAGAGAGAVQGGADGF